MANNVLNITGNPIKDINAKLTFLTSASNVVEWTAHPMVYEAFTLDHNIISVPHFTEVRCVLCVDCVMDPPVLTSANGNLGNSTFACTLQ